MERITKVQLEMLCERINTVTNSPQTPYTSTDSSFKPNAGNYHLSGAYGGWKLERMSLTNGSTGTTDPLSTGYVSKRELYNHLHSFLRGLDAA